MQEIDEILRVQPQSMIGQGVAIDAADPNLRRLGRRIAGVNAQLNMHDLDSMLAEIE